MRTSAPVMPMKPGGRLAIPRQHGLGEAHRHREERRGVGVAAMAVEPVRDAEQRRLDHEQHAGAPCAEALADQPADHHAADEECYQPDCEAGEPPVVLADGDAEPRRTGAHRGDEEAAELDERHRIDAARDPGEQDQRCGIAPIARA